MKNIIAVLIAFVFVAAVSKDGEELIKNTVAIGIIAVIVFLSFVYKGYSKAGNNKKNEDDDEDYLEEMRTKIVGVTNTNDDGTSRQENIKKYVKKGMKLYPYVTTYNNNDAIEVYAKKDDKSTMIGYLRQSIANEIGYLGDDDIDITVLSVTGGTKKKPTLGVNVLLRY